MKTNLFKMLIVGFFIVAFFSCDEEETNNTKACFTVDESSELITGLVIQFRNCSENASTYYWDFGDGETSDATEPTHIFETAGTYNVSLTAFDGSNQNTVTEQIAIIEDPKPVACFTVLETTVSVNTEIDFTNCSEKAESYLWDFGDDNTSTVESPAHTYTSEGTFTVSLTATNASGSDQITKDITVESTSAVLLEDFEGGELPATWTTHDGGDNAGTWDIDDYFPYTGDYHISVNTWSSSLPNDGIADDWVITPKITISEGDILSLYAKSDDSDYLDDLKIYISKGSTAIEDFTYTIAEISGVPYDYTHYEYTLTDISGISDGDDIYIGFYCNSNGWYLYIDDVRVGQPTTKNSSINSIQDKSKNQRIRK